MSIESEGSIFKGLGVCIGLGKKASSRGGSACGGMFNTQPIN
jgi:hypothetical protein